MRPIAGHDRFEYLTALAVAGDLSDIEASELRGHLRGCTACREALREFQALTFGLEDASHREPNQVHQPAGGLWSGLAAWKSAAATAVVVSFAMAAGAVMMWYSMRHSEIPVLKVSTPAPAAVLPPVVVMRGASEQPPAETEIAVRRVAELESQLSFARQASASEIQEYESKMRLLEEQLEAARKAAEKALADRSEQDALLGQEREISAGLRAVLASREAALAESNRRLAGLDRQLHQAAVDYAAQRSVIERQQAMLGTDRDIRDLMGARDLSIIDVFDLDGRGRTSKPFGRIFRTQSKSLIFYAFDLNSQTPKDAVFQAWGHREAQGDRPRSLGIFYVDSKTQNRWMLKFEDPKTLAEVDAVYVTVEPPGGSSRPSGKQLLYAYINRTPNHP